MSRLGATRDALTLATLIPDDMVPLMARALGWTGEGVLHSRPRVNAWDKPWRNHHEGGGSTPGFDEAIGLGLIEFQGFAQRGGVAGAPVWRVTDDGRAALRVLYEAALVVGPALYTSQDLDKRAILSCCRGRH